MSFFEKRETRDADDSLTANLIEESVYGTNMMDLATKTGGQLGYFFFSFNEFAWYLTFHGTI